MQINWVDVIIVVYMVMSVLWGKKRGLSSEIINVFVAFLSWIIALRFYQNFGQSINTWFLISLPSSNAIAFIILAVCIFLLGIFLGRLLKKVMKLSFTSNIETIGGLITGGIQGAIIISIVIVGLVLIPKGFLKREFYTNSSLGNYLVSLNTKIYNWIWTGSGSNSIVSTSK